MKRLDCGTVWERLSPLADHALPEGEAAEVRLHLSECTACSRRFNELLVVKRGLRALPHRQAPPRATTSLYISASKVLAQRARYRTVGAFLSALRDDTSLWFNNLMRPLAIPFAGGLMTATLVFSMFASSYPLRGRTIGGDVPTPIYTEATFKGMVPLEFASGDVVVDLIIDDQGRVLDTKFVAGDPQLKRAIEHMLLYTEFKPATSFGQPVTGRVRLSFGRGRIDVRG